MRFQLLSFLLPLAGLATASQDSQIPLNQPSPDAMPTIEDLLTIENTASIFFSYARELQLSSLFSDKNKKITVLVPRNKAVMALPRKPHQGPKHKLDRTVEISEMEYETLSQENVQRWVSAHIIPEHPIELLGKTYSTMLEGKSVTFKERTDEKTDDSEEWKRVEFEDKAHIIDMREASNGIMYLIDGTVLVD